MDAFIVHDLFHARIALEAARDRAQPIALLSPPEGCRSLGALYFLDMIATAALAVPDATFEDILDCGHSPGLALGAFRAGLKAVTLEGSDDIVAKVRDIARQCDAKVLSRAVFERVLDLGACRDPKTDAIAFLDARIASPV